MWFPLFLGGVRLFLIVFGMFYVDNIQSRVRVGVSLI